MKNKDFVEDITVVSEEDFKKLEEAILNPPHPNEHLRKAMRAYKELLEMKIEE